MPFRVRPPLSAVDFFNQINLLYGSIAEFCNNETCPVMNAGKKCVRAASSTRVACRGAEHLRPPGAVATLHRFEYFWADGKNIKNPIKCSAPDYMEHLMTWVQEQLDDETIFPNRVGAWCHAAPRNARIMC